MEATRRNQTECCMCGDVGFPDKLFQCVRCVYRFQHSYCGNYYEETSTEAEMVCDWCRSQERGGRRHKRATGVKVGNRSDYFAREEIKQAYEGGGGGGSGGKAKIGGSASGSSSSSGKPSGRRYKLLKDVMC